jgi:hypothetical protein
LSGQRPPLKARSSTSTRTLSRMCDWQDETSRLSNQLSTRSNRIGALIHSDVCGPMQVQSIGKASYYVSFHDDSSEYHVFRFIKHKSEVADCFKDFCKLLHAQTGQLVAELRSDNGAKYENNELQIWLRKRRIRHESSFCHTPQQNLFWRGTTTLSWKAR